MQIILVKLTIILVKLVRYKSYRKMPKKKEFAISFLGKSPLKLEKYLKKSSNFNAIPAASTAGPCPTIIGLLLRFYNSVQTEWPLCRP